jgi:3-oxoacyl-[acyl-carrier protein] reductase
MGELDGRRIVVTGSTRGLGKAFALALAAEGAHLIVNGTNAGLVDELVAEIGGGGGTAVGVTGSVADDDVAKSLVTACCDLYGGIDAVVNNAGIVRDRTLMNMTPEEFDEVIAVNLRGTWSVSRHAALAMKDTGGHLLQVVSGSGWLGSVGQTNYAASKAGVLGMLAAWDTELKRYGIRVNALWPVADTDMTQVVITNSAKRAAAAGQDAPAPMTLGFGAPEAVAPVVVYLCSPRADHIRSQIIGFNGSRLGLWQHLQERWVRHQDGWTVDQLAEAVQGADERVATVDFRERR